MCVYMLICDMPELTMKASNEIAAGDGSGPAPAYSGDDTLPLPPPHSQAGPSAA
jgi:hypothetical protein